MPIMAAVSNSDKITGGIGIAAVVVFLVTMLIAMVTKDDFTFGSGVISDLFTEDIFIVGCIIAGALIAVFGLLVAFWKVESKVFIGKVRGILITLSGIALVLLGLTEGNEYGIYLFIVLIILAAVSDVFYNWVADQKIIMIFSLLLALCIVLTGILSQTNDNNALGFMFVLFIAFWLCLVAAIKFIPVVEKEPQKNKKGKAKESEAKKKNAPTPRPYPAKKEEPKPAKNVPKAKAEPKKEEPRKEEPKKEEPKPAPVVKEAPKKEEPKKEEPKPKEAIKVMSSREAAAARESARKKEEESVPVPEPVPEPEPEPEPKPEPEPEPEPVDTETNTDTEEGDDESFEIMEDTPNALLRRATWNKGLRCRRDYGEFQIPIAYVKAKVAVYVMPEAGADDAAVDENLRANGWTVFRYLEKDITDGKEQAEEINKAVKENLRAERAAKKKKSTKK